MNEIIALQAKYKQLTDAAKIRRDKQPAGKGTG